MPTPLALVERNKFNKNPRLATAVGFCLIRATGHNQKMIKIKKKTMIKKTPSPRLLDRNHNRNRNLPNT
jgi:hypothetical protein